MCVRLSALFSAAVVFAASLGAPAHAVAQAVLDVGLLEPLSLPVHALGDSLDHEIAL